MCSTKCSTRMPAALASATGTLRRQSQRTRGGGPSSSTLMKPSRICGPHATLTSTWRIAAYLAEAASPARQHGILKPHEPCVRLESQLIEQKARDRQVREQPAPEPLFERQAHDALPATELAGRGARTRLVIAHVRKSALRFGAHGCAIELGQPRDQRRHLVDGVAQKAGAPVIDPFGHAAAPERDQRRAAQHRLRQDHRKRLLPLDRHQHRRRAAEQRLFRGVADRTDVGDELAVDPRLDLVLEVRLLVRERRDVAGDDQAATQRAARR